MGSRSSARFLVAQHATDLVDSLFAAETKNVDPQIARKEEIDKARTEGILGTNFAEQITTLTGTADFTSGLDDRIIGAFGAASRSC